MGRRSHGLERRSAHRATDVGRPRPRTPAADAHRQGLPWRHEAVVATEGEVIKIKHLYLLGRDGQGRYLAKWLRMHDEGPTLVFVWGRIPRFLPMTMAAKRIDK